MASAGFMISFTVLVLLQTTLGEAALFPAEETALEAIAKKFGQAKWTGDPCGSVVWINCSSSEPSSVTLVSLANKNLTGPLPPELVKLTKIETLNLMANKLTGPIPDWRNLTKMSDLDLNQNQLNGSILNTTTFRNLTRIVLNDNNLTGLIPNSLFRHPNLLLLYIGNNPLTGPLPSFRGLPNLKELSVLSIGQLNGSIPRSIRFLTQATVVNLCDNPNLSGPIPSLDALKRLEYLDLSNCSLNGSIPSLKSSPYLRKIHVHWNDIGGTIPPELFEHPKLEWLKASDNSKIVGEIPDTSMLFDLKQFVFANCSLTGPVPSFQNSSQLLYLELQNNSLSEPPSDWNSLLNIINVNVSRNNITGKLPDFPPTSSLRSVNLGVNHFFGEIPDSWFRLEGLESLTLRRNNLSGPINERIGNLTNLKKLDLSENKFSGHFPEGLTLLSRLESLRLHHNNLSGPIPAVIGSLKNLKTLDLSNNQFIGDIPEGLATLASLTTLILVNNSFTGIPQSLITRQEKGLLNMTYDTDMKVFGGESSFPIGAIVGIAIGVAAVLVVTILVLYWFCARKRVTSGVAKEDLPKSVQAFTSKEIKKLTRNYKAVVGKGGFGPVYYGKLPDGKEVAVKVRAGDSKQGASEFLNEVKLLARLHHRNILPVVGYCLEGHHQILVLAFMGQGSLYDHLYNSGPSFNRDPWEDTGDTAPQKRPPLSWTRRLDIAINVARGLEYLHKDCNPPIIHRDMKASNILLADNLEAKISDLGLSKQLPTVDSDIDTTGVSTAIKGTFGYLDPEYFRNRRLTVKSDIFSFGMVLLELITGKRPYSPDIADQEQVPLLEWVTYAVGENKVESVVDGAMGTDYDVEGVRKVASLALRCMRPRSPDRPSVDEVVETLTEVYAQEKKLSTDSQSTTSFTEEILSPGSKSPARNSR